MKKPLILSAAIITAIIFIVYTQSCKKDSSKVSKTDNYSYRNDTLFATADLANEVAENINKSEIVLNATDKTLLKSGKYLGKRKIRNSLTISDNNIPDFYIFNYDSAGFTIVSADKRLQPILAYSDNGYFTLDSIPIGLKIWFETNKKIINKLRTTNAKQSTVAASQWTSMACAQSLLKSTLTAPCPPPPPVNSSKTTTVGPLLSTTWDQNCYYNAHCPTASGGPCGHAYAGCVATAMAQVMAYWKYPSGYVWSSMPNSSANDAVAVLLSNIGKSVNMQYSGSGSGANSSDIPGALKNTFKYSSAVYSSYNYSYGIVIANLNNKEPVLLNGCDANVGCHEWVCDGYIQTVTTYSDGSGTTELSFSMNWGWSGRYNGWYGYAGWSNPVGNFQYYQGIVYNIHP